MRWATIGHVRVGDAARARQDWSAAAQAYAAALSREPDLHHLWVQLGHMEKEAGRPGPAETAYREAARLLPDDPEPFLHLGHMAKARSEPVDAARHFVTALQRDRANIEAIAELVRLLPDRDEVDPALWSVVLDVLDIDPAEQIADADPLPPGATLLDVTDLLAFFGGRRLPTGIQRVQIEVSLACLDGIGDEGGMWPVFCIYASARRGWIRLPDALFEAVCRLARQGDDVRDPAWTQGLDRLYRHIAVGRTIRFPAGAVLVNLGTSWSDRNHLLDVRIARVRDAIVYVPLVFDLIPFIGPEWFTGSLVRDYRAWFASLLHSSDAYLAISNATRDDLLRVATAHGVPLPASAVAVVRLDGDFRQATAPATSLATRGLEPGGYVLFVSTLEPRKNHHGAFAAWLSLVDEIGEAAVPRLVCVGGRGWLNDELYRVLRERPALRRLVLILHGVPDDELATLYEQCLFVLYPSFYEGWGLPVSEALSYGKVPATSRTSSMPEAGGAFARYFDPNDSQEIAGTVHSLLDARERAGAEGVIRRDYRPRAWQHIAQDILQRTAAATPRLDQTLPRLDGVGSWTLALAHPGSGAQGEALRHGRAWQVPGPDGCRIQGDDAALRFRWAGLPDATLHVRFAGAARAAEVRVGVDGRYQTMAIAPGEVTTFDYPLPAVITLVEISILPLAGDVAVAAIAVSAPEAV